MDFNFFRYCFTRLIVCYIFVIQGCSSSSSSGPAVNTTATESCFNVTISSPGASNTSPLCVTDVNSRVNGLGVYRFVRFNVPNTQSMTFTVTRTSGLNPADPDIQIFQQGTRIALSQSITNNTETLSMPLAAGDYVLQVYEDKYTLASSKLSLTTPLPGISGAPLNFNTSASVTAASAGCTSASTITLSGTITFDLVPHAGNNSLDYNNISAEPVKNTVVELICEGTILLSTTTDNNGNYSFLSPSNIASVFVRIKAQMLSIAIPSYNFTVVDNTQSQALYVMDSAAFSTLTTDILNKNLHAQSGWSTTSSAYTSARVAAPFAILDSVFTAMNGVLQVNPSAAFPALRVNWSINNTTAKGSLAAGQIGSSHYNGVDVYLLGAANNDTDEYDEHVIMHEWAHYFEDKFSRSDSIGGPHSFNDILDIRVAFSEGFSNAYSAIASGDVQYRDSNGIAQASGFGFNLENNSCTNPGWYSECSVQSIIYDLSDSTDDGADMVSLGFLPVYNVLINSHKNTNSLTSLFSFAKPLKDENISVSSLIDTLISGQDIDPITDIYGDSELTNNPGTTNLLPVFIPL